MINKKAWLGILAVTMLGIIISVVLYSYVVPYETTEVMGEQQAAILHAYLIGERARQYISDAAELAIQKAVYELGRNGGYYDIEESCAIDAGDYAVWKNGGTCYPSKDMLKENLENEFLYRFEEYLSSFELPSYEEDEISTLYDIVHYDLNISLDNQKITIVGYPVIETYSEIDMEEDELIDIETEPESTEHESAILISSDTYDFDYIVDPYFQTELAIDLYAAFDAAQATTTESSSDQLYTYYEYDTGKKLFVRSGGSVEEKPLIIRFAIQK